MRRPKSTGVGAADPISPELLERCKSGDQRAWRELVDSTHREVYTLCYRILGNPDDAAEATQDAYLKVWRSLAGFRGDAMFGTWLYRVATNTAITKLRARTRRRGRETGMEDEMLAQMPSAESVEDRAGAKVDVGRLQGALASLPDIYRESVVLRDVYGLSIEEVASHLKISQTAAKVRIHRGRKKLKDSMYPEEPGEVTEET